jgi:hypothetical protein
VIALPTTTSSTQAAGRHLAVGLCSLAIGYWLLAAIGYWLLAYFYRIMLLAHQLLHSLELLSLVCVFKEFHPVIFCHVCDQARPPRPLVRSREPGGARVLIEAESIAFGMGMGQRWDTAARHMFYQPTASGARVGGNGRCTRRPTWPLRGGIWEQKCGLR